MTKVLVEKTKNIENMDDFPHYTNYESDVLESYMQAYKLGNVDCALDIADYYYQRDFYEDAMKWHMVGVENGNAKSMFLLGCIYKNIYNNDAMFEKYMMMAVKLKNSDAMIKMAYHYLNNDDHHKAKEMIIEAFYNCTEKNLVALAKNHGNILCDEIKKINAQRIQK